MLFISHNLGLILETCDRICVMYSGEAVETGIIEDVFDKMQHPYTQALLSAVPVPNPRPKRERIILRGDVPSPINPPKGCHFHTRCPVALERCKTEAPAQTVLGSGRMVSCHLLAV